jgi:hypothetical protein
MYLTAYHFDGEPKRLLAAADRLLEIYPPSSLSMFVSIGRDDGITVIDACDSEQTAVAFRTSAELAASLTAVGLPAPRIEPLGEVHQSIVKASSNA